ncbi:radical SAM protein [bacterium]|nr:radical SAM protein [bacterium]
MDKLISGVVRLHTQKGHVLRGIPVVVLMPHSACNCRCVMCDIWKANQQKQEISPQELANYLPAFRHLGVRWIVLSGGEALLHSNLWKLCELLKSLDVKITLLSTGLSVRRNASQIVKWCDEVIVSLDGSKAVHDEIRNIPHAFDQLADGVRALKNLDSDFRVTGRCVIQRRNYSDLPNIIDTSHNLGLHQISFLAVDAWSTAFNRPTPWSEERASDVALSINDVGLLNSVLQRIFQEYSDDFASGYIAESPAKLLKLHQYFAACVGRGDFPRNICNAPWVSAVIESDGSVKPCFFHPSLGNIHDTSFDGILNSEKAIAFRRQLNVKTDPICRRCVCTLHLS